MNDKPVNEMLNGINEDNEFSIDLFQLLELLWSRKIMIIVLMIAAALLAIIKVEFFTADVYTCESILYVSNRTELTQTMENDMVYGSDIDASRMMSETYMEILTTKGFFKEVSKAIGGKFTGEDISAMMSIAVVNETELLKIAVHNYTPEDTYLVAKGIVEQAPLKLGEIFDGGEIRIVEDVAYPDEPDSKGLIKKTFIAVTAAFMLGCGIVVIMHLLDRTVRNSDDVAKRYNISILGEISQ